MELPGAFAKIQAMKAQKALTIGLFTDDFFGGVARAVEVQAIEFAKQGHRVIIVAPRSPFETLPKGCEHQPVKFWWHKGLADYLGFLSWSKNTVSQLSRNYQFDVVHSHNERGSMFLCARLAKKLNVPHIHTFHSNYAGTHAGNAIISSLNSLFYLRLAPFLLGRLSKVTLAPRTHLPAKKSVVENSIYARYDWMAIARMARHFDAFTSPAPFLIDIVNECTDNKLKDKAHFIANGISPVFMTPKRTRPLNAPIRFMSCGRLDPEKRVDVVLRAFAALNDPCTELHIIGNGLQELPLKALAKKLGITKQVTFLGRLDDRNVTATHYANGDIFLFASYHFETQGLVLGEAACAGEAIIYCDNRLKVGVNQHNSLLVNPTAQAFTEAMKTLVVDKKRLHSMQKASLALAPTLGPEAVAKKTIFAYHTAIK